MKNYLKDEYILNHFYFDGFEYLTVGICGSPYATPRCFTVKTNANGKYIEAPSILKYGGYDWQGHSGILYIKE